MESAIATARTGGMLGRCVAGSEYGFDIEVRVGAGAYVCGEETSLLESLEGKRGQVRAKPPLPAHKGLFGKPTVINNVLSLATRADHPGRGRRASIATTAWAARAAPCRSSSPATSSTAACSRRPSASPSASSSTISAAARASGRPVRAVQVGGPLGAYFPRALFDTPFDYEAFAARDGLIGHGGIVVFDDTVDMAQQARFAMEFCAIESCGKCTPCRIGSTRGVETIDQIIARRATREANLALVEDLCETMKFGSLCALGGFTPYPVMSALTHFPEDFGAATRLDGC